jgi:uncharacterized protein YndB with AHSA1/START domain
MNELGTVRLDGGRRGVRFERVFAAAPEDVWSALADPERLTRWLAPARLDARAGGHVRIEFGPDQVVTGAVLACEPPHVLEYEWRFPGEDESVVRFELSPHGDATLLVLDHRLLEPRQATGYAAGWHAYLDRLAADLRGDSIDWDAHFAEVLPGYVG